MPFTEQVGIPTAGIHASRKIRCIDIRKKSGEFIFAIDISQFCKCLSVSSVPEELSGGAGKVYQVLFFHIAASFWGRYFQRHSLVMCCPAAKVQNTILVWIDRQSGGDYLLQPILTFRNMLQMDMPADIALS